MTRVFKAGIWTEDGSVANPLPTPPVPIDPHPQYTTEAEVLTLLRTSGDGPTAPVLSYGVGGAVSRIDYADGSHKEFAYDAGHGDRLDYIDFTVGVVTTRKTISYNLDGTVHAVIPSTV